MGIRDRAHCVICFTLLVSLDLRPARLIGRTAVELLEDEITDPDHHHRHVSFQPELVVRDSMRPAP